MARVARLQDVKVNLRDEKGKEHTFKHKPLTKASTRSILSSKGVKKNTKTKRVLGRKTDMEKVQVYAAIILLTAGTIFGLTQYTSDPAIVAGGALLAGLLVEKIIKSLK